jgi:hypothetical protein
MSDFNDYDEVKFLVEQIKYSRDYNRNEYAKALREYLGYDELTAVEEWAEENGLIASEADLSELFDEEIAPFVIEQYGEDDKPAMNEAFNDWSDSLCKDEQLHDLQYDKYCYVGKYK